MWENLITRLPADMNDRMESERLRIQRNDQIFKELVLASPVAIYTCDPNGYITFFNAAAVTLWGREPQIGKDRWNGAWKMYYPDGRPMSEDNYPMAEALKDGTSSEGKEIIIERPDHSFRHLLAFPRPIFDELNTIIGAHNTLVDISDQKKGEEKQAILSAIVESSDDAIISKGLDGVITSWNAGAEKIFGYTEHEVIGKHVSILIPPSLQSEEDVIISNIRNGNKVDHYQTERLHKSGRKINVSLTVSPVRDNQGRVTGASKIARDITDLLLTEKKIRQNAERLSILNAVGKVISEKLEVKSVLQHVTDAVTNVTGAAFGAFFYNAINEQGEAYKLYTLSGAPREAFENLGMPRITAIFEPTFGGKGVVRVDDIRKDPRYGWNEPYRGMPEGHLPVVSYLAAPVHSSSGAVIGGLFLGHPEPGVFTEEHEDLVKSISSQAAVALDNSKLLEDVKALSAKKDEFIALASHELKTPLTTIKGYLQLLERREKDETGKIFINKTLTQVDKLNDLISDLLDVSRVQSGKLPLNTETFDMRQLVLEVIETMHYTNKTHHVNFNNKAKSILIKADKRRIEQALINLLSNAVKYSPNADEVSLELETDNENVTVRIKDEGIGLTPVQQHKIFTRFYRAEGNSNIAGLGLGLYLTKEIIERHNGTIGFNSKPGQGSEFYFSLPLN